MTTENSEKKDLKKLLGNPKITFVLGGPGSGKGTQCQKLVEEFGYTHISIGDYMRAEMVKGTKEGERIRKIVNEGNLVPYELTVQVLQNALLANPSKNYLIDGFPRALDQAIHFEQNICETQTVLYYKVSEDICTERCLKRGEETGRTDDNVEAIKKRYKNYIEQTKSVIDLYQKFGKVREIDGSGDVRQIYEQSRKALLPQISFIIGPKTSGKTTLGNALCAKTNMKSIDYNQFVLENELEDQDEETQILALIKSLSREISPRVLIEDFPKTLFQAKFFIKNCTTPSRVFSLHCSKDVCQERMVDLKASNPNYVPSTILSKQIRDHNENSQALIPFFKEHTNYHEINTEENFAQSFEEICRLVEPTIIHVRAANANEEVSTQLKKKVVDKLSTEHGFINLDVNALIRDENERKTEIGQEFLSMVSTGKIITAEMIVKMLRRIIYSGLEHRNKFILTSFPDIIEQAKEFEKNCALISAIIYTTQSENIVDIKNNNLTLFNIDALYQKEFRLKTMSEWDYRAFSEKLGDKQDFGIVFGNFQSGKSTVAEHICKLTQGHLISMPVVAEEVRKRLSTEDEPFEGDVPIEEIEKDIQAMICAAKSSGKRVNFVFDGYMHPKAADFISFVNQFGVPDFVINCQASESCLNDRFKKKNEVDEIGEEQQEEVKNNLTAYTDAQEQFKDAYMGYGKRVKMVDLATDTSLESTLEKLDQQFLPKVVLVNHEKRLAVDTTCSNLAIKYNMIYLSVYQLIKQHIEANTQLGKKLLASKKTKEIQMTSQVKDEFEEAEYSPTQFDLHLVVELIKETIKEKRSNQKFILIEGFCNSGKLLNEDDRLELRFMDELFCIEKHIGDVVAIIGLQFHIEKDAIDDAEIVYEEFEDEEQISENKKEVNEADPEADEEEKEPEPAQEAEGEGDGKKNSFDPKQFQWTVTDRAPKNLPQLFLSVKGPNVQSDCKTAEHYSSSQYEAISKCLDEFCERLFKIEEGKQEYMYEQVLFTE